MKKSILPILLIAMAACGCGKSDDAPAVTNGPVVGENNPPAEAKAAQGVPNSAESNARAAAAGPSTGK